MGRPFDSTDSPLMRQQPFSQFGGAPTRETGMQMPKDGAALPGASDPTAMLMQFLNHPALGPLLRQLLSPSAQPSKYDAAIAQLRKLLEPTSLDSPQMMANRKAQMDQEKIDGGNFIAEILKAAHAGAQ